MSRRGRVYPMLVKLYPASFRREYGDSLVDLFDELIASIGYPAAVRRVGVDLLVTVPRYQLEVIMNATLATRALTWGIGLLVVLGITAVLNGNAWLGPVFLIIALALGLAQRTRLAEALRVVEPSRRNSRFKAAGLSAVCFVVALGAYLAVISDGTATTPGLLIILTLVGLASLVGVIGWLFAALFTPRASELA